MSLVVTLGFFPPGLTTEETLPFSPDNVTIVELAFSCKQLLSDSLSPIALDIFLSDPYEPLTGKTERKKERKRAKTGNKRVTTKKCIVTVTKEIWQWVAEHPRMLCQLITATTSVQSLTSA